MTSLTDVIAPAMYEVHRAVQSGRYTHYWLGGGRGSTKSSGVSVEIILGMMRDPAAYAVAVRKVGEELRESVYEQLLWAIDQLGVSHLWEARISPPTLIYRPTGQKILFRGADKPKKLKSTKVRKGYIRYVWYEEVDEFLGLQEIRIINQSLLRGGQKFDVFYTYNPPQSVSSWINIAVPEEAQRSDTFSHHSTYLDVPREWLGEQFIAEAEHLKVTKPEAYRHEYLGEITGTGGEVFCNLSLSEIREEQIQGFDSFRRGIDFGFASDPFVYVEMQYDKHRRTLYIFRELYAIRLPNRAAAEKLRESICQHTVIIADSAEPKSIAEMAGCGLPIMGARKGPDSVAYGIKFLQDLGKIVIDPVRCPNTAREFSGYELSKDRYGNLIPSFPDKDNHTIDAVRYALEQDIRSVTVR